MSTPSSPVSDWFRLRVILRRELDEEQEITHFLESEICCRRFMYASELSRQKSNSRLSLSSIVRIRSGLLTEFRTYVYKTYMEKTMQRESRTLEWHQLMDSFDTRHQPLVRTMFETCQSRRRPFPPVSEISNGSIG
jgi:hypothetical protein